MRLRMPWSREATFGYYGLSPPVPKVGLMAARDQLYCHGLKCQSKKRATHDAYSAQGRRAIA